MIISFYYYLRIVKAIFMDENVQPIERISIPLMPKVALYTCMVGVLAAGFISFVYDYIHSLSGGM